MNKVENLVKTIISSFFPNTCASCGDIIDEDEHLCDYCREMIERCNPIKRCMKCGLECGNCDCGNNSYCFEGCISPFYSTEISRKAIYGLKFGRKLRNIEFFASEMAFCIKNEYRNIRFDGICYVPLSVHNELKRGFNQSMVLAERISELTGIELIKNALYCKKSADSQHDLSSKERFRHVDGLYSWNFRNKEKTLLLIDDIKTTGATLNECSKQLLLSGASRIYCVTAIVTKKIIEDLKNGENYGNRYRN